MIVEPSDRVNRLFEELQSLGFDRAYVRRMMPEWWEDVAAESPGAVAELKVALARQFHLDPKDLFAREPHAKFLRLDRVKFKRRIGQEVVRLTPAASIASAVAHIVAEGTIVPFQPLPQNPLLLRTQILAENRRWVGLGELMNAAWDHGIPVIHLVDLPGDLTRMDGVVVTTPSRPVVVLMKRSGIAAWLLFILAHELGHLALGHLSVEDTMLVDDDSGEETLVPTQLDEDIEEVGANAYAFALLSGMPIRYLPHPDSTVNAPALVQAAFNVGQETQVDPGHIILRYGYENRAWATAIAALRLIDDGRVAKRSFSESLRTRFDRNRVAPDAAAFLYKIVSA